MADSKKNRVAVLGGSFNPPHIGHVEICKYLLGGGMCDCVWVVPCYEHPFGKPLAPFQDRLTMCRFTFQDFGEKVRVTDVERLLGGTSHTVRTLKHLRYQWPENQYALVVGSDVANEKKEWKDFDEIKAMAELIEVPRGKKSPITDISSTEIRQKIMHGGGFRRFVPMPVAVYIVTHGLYQT